MVICFRVGTHVHIFMRIPADVHAMSLEEIRQEISRLDTEIINLIAQRQKLAAKIARSLARKLLFSAARVTRVRCAYSSIPMAVEKLG